MTARPVPDLDGTQHSAARRMDALNSRSITIALIALAVLLGMALAGLFE
jgi:hypothetical protein